MPMNAAVQGPTYFSVKGQRVFSTLWPIPSPSLELQCEGSHMQTHRCGNVQIKLYLQKQATVC